MVYYSMDWLLYPPLPAPGNLGVPHPGVQTRDLHSVMYNLTDGAMFVADAAGKGEAGPKMACRALHDRAFVRLDMAALFKTQPRLCIN